MEWLIGLSCCGNVLIALTLVWLVVYKWGSENGFWGA